MGCVYILTNEGNQGLVKIGQTGGLAEARAKQLSRETAAPYQFEVAYALYCEWYIKLEKDIHFKLAYCRVSPNKEFFKCPVDDAIMELKQLHLSYLDIEISSLESRKTKLIEGIEKAEKAEQALLAKGRDARQKTDFMESEVTRLEAEITKAHQQIEVLRSEAGKAEKELLERARSTRREVESLESEVERLKAKENVLSKEVEDLEKEKIELKKQNSAKGRVDDIFVNKSSAILKSEIEHLKAEKDRLRKEVGSLKDQKKYINAAGQIEVIDLNKSSATLSSNYN
ncbi:MAG: GIY-YIG nuclease family protein [Candidatus Poribacteria bacterium]|nr:GIY-YIG nuclease family protein [Candidatus Poribacteria bacterium]